MGHFREVAGQTIIALHEPTLIPLFQTSELKQYIRDLDNEPIHPKCEQCGKYHDDDDDDDDSGSDDDDEDDDSYEDDDDDEEEDHAARQRQLQLEALKRKKEKEEEQRKKKLEAQKLKEEQEEEKRRKKVEEEKKKQELKKKQQEEEELRRKKKKEEEEKRRAIELERKKKEEERMRKEEEERKERKRIKEEERWKRREEKKKKLEDEEKKKEELRLKQKKEQEEKKKKQQEQEEAKRKETESQEQRQREIEELEAKWRREAEEASQRLQLEETQRQLIENRKKQDEYIRRAENASNDITTIYVSNIPYDPSETYLRELCGPFGAISAIKKNNQPYGFVQFENRSDAERAINALHHTDRSGERITVRWATRQVKAPTLPTNEVITPQVVIPSVPVMNKPPLVPSSLLMSGNFPPIISSSTIPTNTNIRKQINNMTPFVQKNDIRSPSPPVMQPILPNQHIPTIPIITSQQQPLSSNITNPSPPLLAPFRTSPSLPDQQQQTPIAWQSPVVVQPQPYRPQIQQQQPIIMSTPSPPIPISHNQKEARFEIQYSLDGYRVFFRENRRLLSNDLTKQQVAHHLSTMWNNLTNEGRDVYNKRAESEKTIQRPNMDQQQQQQQVQSSIGGGNVAQSLFQYNIPVVGLTNNNQGPPVQQTNNIPFSSRRMGDLDEETYRHILNVITVVIRKSGHYLMPLADLGLLFKNEDDKHKSFKDYTHLKLKDFLQRHDDLFELVDLNQIGSEKVRLRHL
ncbi:hypothetical protein AKO1_003528 [Acrasis kona]|uniref:Uncharacterized protein n=1 Tax=Acrasis kona TaxID=1008807 RepID=A0AAW2Z6E8_9EUKA